MSFEPLRFIAEPVEALFDEPPALEKKPGLPKGFEWRGRRYRILACLREWHDYQRRGRMAKNMRPDHAAAAERAGSWGVGRDHYRVRVDTGQVFDLYYDRAPGPAGKRKGGWILFRELTENPEPEDGAPA